MTKANSHQAGRRSTNIIDLLGSVRFAVLIVAILAVVCTVGTLLPQGSDVAAYLQQNPGHAGRMKVLGVLGLTSVYSSWWFLGLLGMLAASIATCSTRRFLTALRVTGATRVRVLGSMLTHISMLLILAGGIARGVWGVKGWVELREGQTVDQFVVGDERRPLPFGIQLADFSIETYEPAGGAESLAGSNPQAMTGADHQHLVVRWPDRGLKAEVPVILNQELTLAPQDETPSDQNSYRLTALRMVSDFVIDTDTKEVRSRSDEPNNPAILLAIEGPGYSNNRWIFANHPDFSMRVENGHGAGGELPLEISYHYEPAAAAVPEGPIKSFRSDISLVQSGQVRARKVIEVNHPLRFGGWSLYQSGYRPEDLSWSSIQIVRDPGVPAVYAGFSLMIVGLFMVFYVSPWMMQRRKPA